MRKPSIIAIMMLASGILASASDRFSYLEMPSEDGYPSRINSIFVNPNGYAMVGSEDGLMLIMNSRQKRIINSEPKTDGFKSIPGDIVYVVKKDQFGVKWILTDKGFVGYRTDGPGPEILEGSASSNFALSIFCHGNDVYFGGDCVLWKYSYETKQISTVMKIEARESMFPITSMMLIQNDVLVLASSSSDILFTYNLKTGISGQAPDNWNYHVLCSFTDSRGDLWISDMNKGVRQIDAASGKEIASYTVDNTDLSSDIVRCIGEYEGRILLGTSNGLCILDPATKHIDRYGIDFPETGNIPLSDILSVTSDTKGNIWCGRNNGGLVILFKPEYGFLPVGSVVSIIEDSEDRSLWLAVRDEGLFNYRTDTHELTRIEATADIPINSIAFMDAGHICMATSDAGLLIFGKKDHSIVPFEDLFRQNSLLTRGYGIQLTNDDINRMVAVSNNAMRYDPEEGILNSYPWYKNTYDNHLHPVGGSHGKYMYDNYSFYKWSEREESKLEKIHTLESSGFIWSASLSQDNDMWYISGMHLYRYDMDSGETEPVHCTFMSRPQMVLCDNRGLVWIGTSQKLYFYDPKKETLGMLQDIDGISDCEYFPHSKLISSDGTIFFGTSRGLVTIHPGLVFDTEEESRAAMLSCSVDGKMCRNLGNIRIPYNHTSIDFSFFIVASDILRSREYRVTIDGDGRYYEKSTTTPDVTMNRIKPGHYEISLSWTSKTGSWYKPMKVAQFDVVDVWYRQWWMYVMEFFLVIGGFRLFYEYKKRIKDKARETKSNDERYNFIINISHEFRTPLTLILGPIKKLLERPEDLSPEASKQLKRMYTQAERMNFLLDTIVTSDKMKTGKAAINFETVDFNKWVTEKGSDFINEAKSNNMEIIFKLDERIGTIRLDDNICRVAYYNLIANAIKHNEPGMPITVRTEFIPGREVVRLNVRDHGTILGEFDVSSIFDNYYNKTEDKTGFGVGLVFSKNMVNRIGGELGAYNNTGDKGATFWLDLQMVSDHEYFA